MFLFSPWHNLKMIVFLQFTKAKLGEKNKFYYDEKLKRWVEEGAVPPAEEPALPPPPTTAGFQNGVSDYNVKHAMKNEGSPPNGNMELNASTPPEPSCGIPPIPPSSNQFSARGRMGIRSRHVNFFVVSFTYVHGLFREDK